MSGVLVTGSGGQLGRALEQARPELTGSTTDVTNLHALIAEVRAHRPDVIIHAAAWTDVDGCEQDPGRAVAINGAGTANVVAAAAGVEAHVVYVSTNFVFDGALDQPYREEDGPNPINAYGRSKLIGELATQVEGTVVRTGWLCGGGPRNLVAGVLKAAEQDRPLSFVDDVLGQPTDADELAVALLALADGRPGGTWHVAGSDVMTPFAAAVATLEAAGLDPARVAVAGPADPIRVRPARRPVNGVLDTTKWTGAGHRALPPFTATLPRLIEQLRSR